MNSAISGGVVASPLAADFPAACCAAKAPDIGTAARMIAAKQTAALRPTAPSFS